MGNNYIENSYAKIWIENDIIYGEYAPGIIITLEIAHQVVATRLSLSDGNTYPMFIDVRKVKFIDKEARMYLAKHPDALRFINASALIIESQLLKIMTNFFIRIENPPIPVKMLTDEKQAIEWLERYK
jgi:hypothetical protein